MTSAVCELSLDEISAVDGGALTAGDVAKIGLVAITVSPTFGPAGVFVAAAGATAVLIGGTLSGMGAA